MTIDRYTLELDYVEGEGSYEHYLFQDGDGCRYTAVKHYTSTRYYYGWECDECMHEMDDGSYDKSVLVGAMIRELM
jgi:ribosomal protein L37AE/L43A